MSQKYKYWITGVCVIRAGPEPDAESVKSDVRTGVTLNQPISEFEHLADIARWLANQTAKANCIKDAGLVSVGINTFTRLEDASLIHIPPGTLIS